MNSAPSVASTTDQTANGMNTGGTMSYGGSYFNIQNPTDFSTSQLNAQGNQYVQNNAAIEGDLSNAALNPFSGNYYSQLQATNQSHLDTSLNNQYAAMGLGGSSALAGGVANANINNQMAVNQLQMQSQLQYANAMSGINQQGYNDVMGIQNQYGNYEDAYNQSLASLLGMQQQANSSNNQMIGGIAGAALSGAGSYLGGANRT